MLLFLEVKTWRGVFDLLIRKSEQSSPRHERNTNKKTQLSKETVEKRQERLAKMRANAKKRSTSQPVKERQEKLIDSPIHEQTHAKNNIDMFHTVNLCVGKHVP